MKVRLFATGISTNVRSEERPVSGYILFGVLGYGVISPNTWSELTAGEAEARKKEIEEVQPKLIVIIRPIHEMST